MHRFPVLQVAVVDHDDSTVARGPDIDLGVVGAIGKHTPERCQDLLRGINGARPVRADGKKPRPSKIKLTTAVTTTVWTGRLESDEWFNPRL